MSKQNSGLLKAGYLDFIVKLKLSQGVQIPGKLKITCKSPHKNENIKTRSKKKK